MSFKEIKVPCKDHVVLFGRRYFKEKKAKKTAKGSPQKKIEFRVFCAHGYIDNCHSFYKVAPALVNKLLTKGGPNTPVSVELYALDFPSHGRSTHEPLVVLHEYVYYMYDAIHGHLKWKDEKVMIVGHSFGATIALMYASIFPVYRLVMLDGMGPETLRPPSLAMKKHILDRFHGKPPQSIYKTFEDAVAGRVHNQTLSRSRSGGKQYISPGAAAELTKGNIDQLEDGRWQFVFDSRIKTPAIVYMVQEQKDEIYRAVQKACADEDGSDLFEVEEESKALKICVILANDGTYFTPKEISHFREMIKPEVFLQLPGSHHFHMDEETCDEVIKKVVNFLLE